jgi:hypothetical protein
LVGGVVVAFIAAVDLEEDAANAALARNAEDGGGIDFVSVAGKGCGIGAKGGVTWHREEAGAVACGCAGDGGAALG